MQFLKVSATHICIRGQATITQRVLPLRKTCHLILDIHSNITRPVTMSCCITCILGPICVTDTQDIQDVTLKRLERPPVKPVFNYLHITSSCRLWCSFLTWQIQLLSLCFYCSEYCWNPSFAMLFRVDNTGPWTLKNLKIWGPSKQSTVLGIAKSHMGQIWYICWPLQFHYWFFGQ